MSAYKVIDVKNWKRAVHCEVFRNSMQPQYGVSLELDITNFLRVIQAKGYSFTFPLFTSFPNVQMNARNSGIVFRTGKWCFMNG